MSIPLIINGQTFQYPETGDSNWGVQATLWASAVTTGMLQKAGGTFTLLAEVDFGASFGLKSLYYKTRTANNASAGQFRLAHADVVSWRNQANSGNLDLSVNASDVLLFNGVAIGNFVSVLDTNSVDLTLAAGVLSGDLKLSAAAATAGFFKATASIETDGLLVQAQNAATAQTGFLTSTDWNTFNNKQTAGSYITALTGDVVAAGPGSASASIQAGVIVNSMISASAAVAFSKLAALTSGNLLVGSAGNVATSVALSGDATLVASGALTIANNAVSNAKLAQMPTLTLKGNNTGGTTNALDLTATQTTAILNAFVGDSGSGGTKGLVPAPITGDATKFLRGDGVFATPAGAGDVVGPGSATANAPVLFNGTTGKLIKDSGALGANGTFYSVVGGVPAWATLTAATTSTAGTVTNQANGSFTATFTQAGGYSQNSTIKYRKINNAVIFNMPDFNATATANARLATASGTIPSDLRPTGTLWLPLIVRVTNNVQTAPGLLEIASDGTMQIWRDFAQANFTSGVGAGIGGGSTVLTFSYNLD